MINLLVCVPSPFLDIHPESLSPDHPSRSPRYREAEISQGEGSNMQIDLANTLVCKVYFVYHALFIISPQARAPLPWEGLGVGFLPSFGGVGGEASPPSLWEGRGGFSGLSGLPVRLIIHHDGLFFKVHCHAHRDGMVESFARKRDIGSGAVLFE